MSPANVAVLSASLVAATSAPFDLSRHQANRRAGRDGWPAEPALLQEIVDRFSAAVEEVLTKAGSLTGAQAGSLTEAGSGSLAETELVVGTCYGTSRVAELLHEQLRLGGPKWIDPESFIYYSPHSLASAAALAHGLGGAGLTLTGPGAGIDALGHALRRIARSGKPVLLGGYEALTPVAAAGLAELGLRADPERGDVVALLLQPWRPGDGARLTYYPDVQQPADVPVLMSGLAVGPDEITALWLSQPAAQPEPLRGWDLQAAFPGARLEPLSASSPAVAPLHALATASQSRPAVVAAANGAGYDLMVLS